jgi:hypothetical protein
MWFNGTPRTDTDKTACLEETDTLCPKHDNHSNLYSQHNQGYPIGPFNEHENLHFDDE